MSAARGLANVSDRVDGSLATHPGYSVQWLSQDHEPEWDDFVLRHPLGSLYHTSEWKRVIEKAFTHIRGRFLVLRDGDSEEILGGLPVYRVSSWLLGRHLVSVPFATVCDPLVTTVQEWNVLVPEPKAKTW
jgi:hypothetical protein